MLSLKTTIEEWPVTGSFRISRSEITKVTVAVVTASRNGYSGRGECRPYPRYGETPQSVKAQIDSLVPKAGGLSIDNLQDILPAGAARNAADLALWDLRAQEERRAVTDMLGLAEPRARQTAFTLSVAAPQAMAVAAQKASSHQLLKMKTGQSETVNCVKAVLTARPDAQLIIDANEALTTAQCRELQSALAGTPTRLIEQPIPAGSPLPDPSGQSTPIICADEALHTRSDLPALWAAGYRVVNIKLDKAGGLTEAVKLARAAKTQGFQIMLGCMVGTSLAMMPALLLESFADVIDLDGALLLERDHTNGVGYEDGMIRPAPKGFWGYPR